MGHEDIRIIDTNSRMRRVNGSGCKKQPLNLSINTIPEVKEIPEAKQEVISKPDKPDIEIVQSKKKYDKLFEKELIKLLNTHGVDSYLNMPDFKLAKHIVEYIKLLSTARDTR